MKTLLNHWRSKRKARRARAAFEKSIELFLRQYLPEIQIKLRYRLFSDLIQRASQNELAPETYFEEAPALRIMSIVLLFQLSIQQIRTEIDSLQSKFQQFRREFSKARDITAQNQIIIAYIQSGDTGPRSIRSDTRAFNRYFGIDAITERVGERRAQLHHLIEVSLSSMGSAIQSSMADATPFVHTEAENRLRSAYLDNFFLSFLEPGYRWPLKLAAAKSLSQLYGALNHLQQTSSQDREKLSQVIVNGEEHPWVRFYCFDALSLIDANKALRIRHDCFTNTQSFERKDFLLRRLIVEACPFQKHLDSPAEFIAQCVALNDPSEHVRLGLCKTIPKLIGHYPLLLAELGILGGLDQDSLESSLKVQAQAVKALGQSIRNLVRSNPIVGPDAESSISLIASLSTLLTDVLTSKAAPLAIETACDEVSLCTTTIVNKQLQQRLAFTIAPWVSALTLLRGRNDCLPHVQERASASLEIISRDLDETRRQWTQKLATICQSIPPGNHKKIAIDAFAIETLRKPHFVGRILAELSRKDWGLCAELRNRHLTIYRGDRFRSRLWRILHEIIHHAPNKRQGFQHSIGRIFIGSIRAHPGRMDEVTPTVVPGERVTIEREGAWGRHLPLIDDLLGYPCPSESHPISIYSSQGVTQVWFRRSPIQNFWSRLRLSFHYNTLAQLRSKCLESDDPSKRSEFLRVLDMQFGVEVQFSQHPAPGNSTETEIPQQLAALFTNRDSKTQKIASQQAASWIPIMEPLSDWFDHHAHYFLSLSGNTQASLGFFCVAMMGYFLLDGFRRKFQLEAAKARIPFTMGGWGTRGKSGTERLKAGIFHGLGYRVFSKTTGCEAMFIHSVSDGPAVEIYAFRPYGKATIWEQRDLVELAANLDSDIFLWECMALNPGYVEILQDSWMKDSFVSITNAYPDHEDIQGPAGINVAEVISRFTPRNAKVFSSEINFQPIIRDAAKRKQSTFVDIPDDAGDFIASDLLDLFPYQEHPRNIALVATMAEELGIQRDLAILTMAENVVPDLGVLKVYPDVRVRGRVLRFINGCSANERTGFINNWKRTNCDKFDAENDAKNLLVTVVNNRDDRVSRSEVFSRILVNDTATDRHILIGTNLRGLIGYIHSALDAFLDAQIILNARDLDLPNSGIHERLFKLMARLRIPTPHWSKLSDRLTVYASAIGATMDRLAMDEIRNHCQKYFESNESYQFSVKTVHRNLEKDHVLQTLLENSLIVDDDTQTDDSKLPEVLSPPEKSDVIVHFIRQFAKIIVFHRLLRALENIIRNSDSSSILQFHENMRAAYRELFFAQIHVIENPLITGDQILDECARGLPPGTDITIMGTQNIKGTGLDFAYRWIALDTVCAHLSNLYHRDPMIRVDALSRLEAFEDHGFADIGLLRVFIKKWSPQGPEETNLRDRIAAKCSTIHAQRIEALAGSARRADIPSKILSWIEGWIEFLDGAYRFHFSRRLMKDLSRQQISHERAAVEMRNIYARTKGGWLRKALAKRSGDRPK